jgi:hypothetical protein
MRRVLRVLLIGCCVSLGVMVSYAVPANAACHHFSVSASPNPVAEGKTVTVTVSRDANVAPSNVDLSTIDETAKAGQDYAPVSRTVSFTNDVQQSFPIAVVSHSTSEPARTFRLHLSKPGGCAVNPNFVVDPDVRVTISANGVSPTSSANALGTAPSTTAGARATTTTSRSAATTTVSSTASSSEPSATAAPTSSTGVPGQAQLATKHGGGGGSGTIIGLVVLGALVLAGGGFLLYRRRVS